MKKVLGLAVASFALLVVVAPVSAENHDWNHNDQQPVEAPSVLNIMNSVGLGEFVGTTANTGNNSVYSATATDDAIMTGDAMATANIANALNVFRMDDCNCLGVTNVFNRAHVWETVKTYANTGHNSVNASTVTGDAIDTGDATAKSVVENVVNSVLIGVTTTTE